METFGGRGGGLPGHATELLIYGMKLLQTPGGPRGTETARVGWELLRVSNQAAIVG